MTKRFTIGAALLIAAVDAAFVATGTQTISEFLYVQSKAFPVVPLIAGIIVGHIWWPVRTKQ